MLTVAGEPAGRGRPGAAPRCARALLLQSDAMSEYEPASEKLTPPRTHRRTDRCSAATNGSMRHAERTNSTMTTMPQSMKSPSSRRAPIVPSPNRVAIAQLPANAGAEHFGADEDGRADDGQHVFPEDAARPLRRRRVQGAALSSKLGLIQGAPPGKRVA